MKPAAIGPIALVAAFAMGCGSSPRYSRTELHIESAAPDGAILNGDGITLPEGSAVRVTLTAYDTDGNTIDRGVEPSDPRVLTIYLADGDRTYVLVAAGIGATTIRFVGENGEDIHDLPVIVTDPQP